MPPLPAAFGRWGWLWWSQRGISNSPIFMCNGQHSNPRLAFQIRRISVEAAVDVYIWVTVGSEWATMALSIGKNAIVNRQKVTEDKMAEHHRIIHQTTLCQIQGRWGEITDFGGLGGVWAIAWHGPLWQLSLSGWTGTSKWSLASIRGRNKTNS